VVSCYTTGAHFQKQAKKKVIQIWNTFTINKMEEKSDFHKPSQNLRRAVANSIKNQENKGCCHPAHDVNCSCFGVLMPVVTIELSNKRCRFAAMAPGAIGKVVATANRRDTLLIKAKKAGVENPVIMPVLRPDTRYIF